MQALEVFERRLNMKSAALASFALLFSSIALAGQYTVQVQKSYGVAGIEGINAANTVGTPMSVGCPVSLRAQHGVSGNILSVDRNRPKGIAQLLHLTLTNPDSRQIVAAKLRVHGLTGKARVTQTLSGQNDSDAAQNLDVRFSPGPGNAVSADLWVPGMTAVLSIDLNSVTFADGSTRSFSAREACHVAPDPLMLINGR